MSSDNLDHYVTFLKKQKINYLILLNFSEKYRYLFKDCSIIEILSSPLFTQETRNPFNRVDKYYVTIIKFDENQSQNCIKINK
jgi:hypothetical protein